MERSQYPDESGSSRAASPLFELEEPDAPLRKTNITEVQFDEELGNVESLRFSRRGTWKGFFMALRKRLGRRSGFDKPLFLREGNPAKGKRRKRFLNCAFCLWFVVFILCIL
jgi:hypothetical protein